MEAPIFSRDSSSRVSRCSPNRARIVSEEERKVLSFLVKKKTEVKSAIATFVRLKGSLGERRWSRERSPRLCFTPYLADERFEKAAACLNIGGDISLSLSAVGLFFTLLMTTFAYLSASLICSWLALVVVSHAPAFSRRELLIDELPLDIISPARYRPRRWPLEGAGIDGSRSIWRENVRCIEARGNKWRWRGVLSIVSPI